MDIGSALRATRKSAGLTQHELACLSGISRQSVVALEQGTGRMSAIAKVAPHISFRITGLAAGDCPAAQIRSARLRRRMTQSELASKAGVSLPTVRSVERNAGSIKSMSALIAVLAPQAYAAPHIKAHWQVRKDIRLTPPEIIEQIVDSFGPISIDPAFAENSFVSAERFLSEAEDGLATKWSGHLAFVNPPFSDLTRWIDRCANACENREVEMIVGLFPARTETATFRNRVFGKADVLLLPRRLSFYDENRTKLPPAPFALMICVWGASQNQTRSFAEATDSLIVWSDHNRPR